MSDREALLLSSGNGPGECRQAVGHLLSWLSTKATQYGVDLDVSTRDAAHGPASAVVVLSGARAGDLVRSVEGVILWRCQSELRPGHKRKNWFVQAFRLPAATDVVRIDPAAVEMQAIRAGGPGGQHQNKTSSAIRARWTSEDGKVYAVVVRDNRSQHQNRRLALERLAALAAAEKAEADAAREGETWVLHGQLQRGEPRRIFEGRQFKEVK
ncbi:peptide chain release factor-like protein [Rhodovulum sulfidophilum]|uniref:peptide chain release factor-like protein n=1 Tax=Rhodovulum sulfidophilum TaxID=35806 RepID=UPI000950F891|nr:peptide chain release factor-like protein [Rhodovulum sulfidophilum]MBL3552513.1 peptide chain release factor-like protein [Rhodovulum sulfidophilum]OLS49960.1 peptide chain release factor-like protein [Rhodovulum sulfidophilum]